MPCIWGTHNRRQLFLDVVIFPVATATLIKSPQMTRQKSGAEGQGQPPAIFRALVDTGATTTCITRRVADCVGLKPVGKTNVITIAGENAHNNYLFHIGFPTGPMPPDGKSYQGSVQINRQPLQGPELVMSSGFDVLLGMDIISTGSLAVEGSGTFSFSF